MLINVSTSSIPFEVQEINNSKKVLILGKGSSNNMAREILSPYSKEEALSLYGQSELYDAYCLSYDLGIKNIYTSNCYAESDYIRIIDKVMHYDFDYLVPIGIYLSDKFYNPLTDKDEYYIAYILKQLVSVNSLTTILTTERHASLYEDFDTYTIAMTKAELTFTEEQELQSKGLLKEYGNNLNFVYNNLEDVPYSNIVLASMYCNRQYAQYFNSLDSASIVYHIDNNDVKGLKAMYFKYNYYSNNITLENPLNFKTSSDIYNNALIDDVIKRVIKEIDLSNYKGRIFNPYIQIAISNDLTKKLNQMKGKMFSKYTINKISFKKTDATSGHIVVDFSIIPYGTFEEANIIMGVI